MGEKETPEESGLNNNNDHDSEEEIYSGGDAPSIKKKDDDKTNSEDYEPPDNGPFYCSLCNWYNSFFERFDKPFVLFFTI